MKAAEILALKETALAEARAAGTSAQLEQVRIKYLGRKGCLPKIMEGLKEAPPAERPAMGRYANELKQELSELLETRRDALASATAATSGAAEVFDPTLPGRWRALGARHPISRVIEDAIRIFDTLGFSVADGPDIETEYHNFDALNTPEDHPARDTQDTFWLESGQLLRTQTSPVQIRVMESRPPPVRVIAAGRCYRRDTTDATHSANFHQIEGLYVNTRVSLADLKGDLTWFAQRLMGPEVKVRFRPHFFPFTEPSVEYDFSCHLCRGKGCRMCKQSGWIEISGAGMVNPKVFAKVGYDPEAVTGYAFGLGVERLAMIRYGLDDIRLLYDNDKRFLEQLAQ
ncbi:MAG: phenylalanine--tRNA ligase subunit alpha [Lentisphaerae bacterium]|nr:phenylalanine--tRNA ligase subunit alpha [Lentisphaerota bacterium]